MGIVKEHFIRLKVGLLEHCEDGRMTPTMMNVYVVVLGQADYGTGFWKGSAAKVFAAWGAQLSLRTIQRALEALCQEGYLKSFHTPGQRHNYPVAINKYLIKFGKHKGYWLNASATTVPENPVYEPYEEENADSTTDRDTTLPLTAPKHGGDLARLQDIDVETKKERREKSAKAEIVEQAETDSLLSPVPSDNEKQKPEKPSSDYRAFQKRFKQEAGIAAIHTEPMRALYADLVAKYSEAEVLDAIPEGVARQRRDGLTRAERNREALGRVMAQYGVPSTPPPLKDKWAARKFLADDAADIIEARRAGKPSMTDLAMRNTRRPDGTYEGELPMLLMPER